MEYKKAVTFSFDDGVTQDIRFIGILNKYGLKGTFNLNSGLLGTSGSLSVLGQTVSHNKVKKEDVIHIYEGHEVAAHTLTHPFLPSLSSEEVVKQVESDRMALSEIVKDEVVGFAYPGGGVNFNENVSLLIKNDTGVKYARTIVPTYEFKKQANLFVFNPTLSLTKDSSVIYKLCNDFINLNDDEFSLFYVWGHSYEFDAGNRWDLLEEFCSIISGKRDILYCTNKEAFAYGGML